MFLMGFLHFNLWMFVAASSSVGSQICAGIFKTIKTIKKNQQNQKHKKDTKWSSGGFFSNFFFFLKHYFPKTKLFSQLKKMKLYVYWTSKYTEKFIFYFHLKSYISYKEFTNNGFYFMIFGIRVALTAYYVLHNFDAMIAFRIVTCQYWILICSCSLVDANKHSQGMYFVLYCIVHRN